MNEEVSMFGDALKKKESYTLGESVVVVVAIVWVKMSRTVLFPS